MNCRSGGILLKITLAFGLSTLGVGAQPVPVEGVVKMSADTALLHATGSNVLVEAIHSLSRAFNIPAGFEGVKLLNPKDLVDMTSPKYQPKSIDDHALSPRGGPLDVAFRNPARAASADDIRIAVRAVLDEYHRLGYPGRYSFELTAGAHPWLYVYPVATTDASGKLVKVSAVTQAPIEVAIRDGERPFEILTETVDAARRTSADKLIYGGLAGLGFREGIRKPEVTSGPMHAVFDSLSDAAGIHFWQLLYEPSPQWKMYFFAFRRD